MDRPRWLGVVVIVGNESLAGEFRPCVDALQREGIAGLVQSRNQLGAVHSGDIS